MSGETEINDRELQSEKRVCNATLTKCMGVLKIDSDDIFDSADHMGDNVMLILRTIKL
jgi:hypothetical protein